MAGAGAAFDAVANAVDVDIGAEAGRIDVGGLWSEDHIDAGVREFLRVVFEGARVFGEVFFGAKLRRVDENRCDDLRGFAASALDERHVTGVEGAHGGDEADYFIFGARQAGGFFHPGYGSDCFHCWESLPEILFMGRLLDSAKRKT